MTERLKQCIDAGDVASLFPLLRTWTREDLTELVSDVEQWSQEGRKAIETVYDENLFKPEFLFSKKGQKALDEAAQEAHINIFGIAAEILSVAYYYLERR